MRMLIMRPEIALRNGVRVAVASTPRVMNGGTVPDLRSRSDDEGMTDRFELERFVAAQDAGGTYQRALSEIRRGRKSSHWMWFVFPQIAGLGYSATAQRYAIEGLDEARAYLDHPVLGPRLVESAAALTVLTTTAERSATEIFGEVDARKLRSSMTLFSRAAPTEPLFARVLDLYFGGNADPETDRRLPTP
jgi:uncharacterized protein (DUF1810 family)